MFRNSFLWALFALIVMVSSLGGNLTFASAAPATAQAPVAATATVLPDLPTVSTEGQIWACTKKVLNDSPVFTGSFKNRLWKARHLPAGTELTLPNGSKVLTTEANASPWSNCTGPSPEDVLTVAKGQISALKTANARLVATNGQLVKDLGAVTKERNDLQTALATATNLKDLLGIVALAFGILAIGAIAAAIMAIRHLKAQALIHKKEREFWRNINTPKTPAADAPPAPAAEDLAAPARPEADQTK